ncbi:Uncharacterized conserved protein [Singulisphaera sp. GP187]|uniref:DUF1254 domain-containing protein n=1 Tax=Singulisphaera sp. GP187 TaxID=1882752 RepID=UPI00092AAC14|nr:DUF1254 domain-containing protein [Singulisphaera sp. GP187]SIO22113.1 Uncharacterized conserved protein [Singulisphaera sp. GP187]
MRTPVLLTAPTMLFAGTLFAWLASATAADLPGKLTEAEAAQLATEAYVYGYPLVLMDISRQVMTAVPKPTTTAAPINQFNDSKEFPDATFTSVVSPNADTLYSFSWLDLSKEPLVLILPDMGDRYYLMQMLDGWTNVFASPGTRTTGNKKGAYAIVGPNFTGKVPDAVTEIKSPTSLVWIIGRTQTDGKSDFAAVCALKAQYKLIPLSAWGKNDNPPADEPVNPKVDAKTPPVEQVAKMDAAAFFGRLADLLRDNPPAAADKEMVENLAKIGVVPGKPFVPAKLDEGVAKGLERGVSAGRDSIIAEAKKPQGKLVNGWDMMMDIGRYGTNYQFRAVVALVGLGANLPDDAIYPHAKVDSDGKPLSGANRYTIHFPRGQLPPVEAFWSITMYNSKQFFVDNPIDRYAIGNRDKLQFNEDGSLTLSFQNESPGKDREPNWLPAPKDSFNLFMRLYWPKQAILDGSWKPPAIERVK